MSRAPRPIPLTDRIAWILLCVFVFTIPWEKSVFVPGFGTIAKMLGILAFAAGAAGVLLRRAIRPVNLVLVFAGLFVVWSGATYIWSLDRTATAARVITLAQLLAMLWLIWEYCRGAARARQLMATYVAGALAGAGIAFVRYFLDMETYYRRYAAAGFDPNDFGVVLALSIPMALYLAFHESRRWSWVWALAAAVVIAAVLLTASRTALLATLVALSFGFWTWPLRNRPLRIASAILLLLIGLSLVRIAPAPSRSRLATIPKEITRGSLNDRKQIWKAGILVWLDHPVLGVGAGAYPEAVRPLIGEPDRAGFRYVAHNTFLSVLVECGLIGFFFYALLMLCLIVFIWMLAPWERALWGVMLVVWATGVSTLTWEHYKPTWLLFGFITTAWARAWHRELVPRKIRVLEVIPTLKRAGAERMVVALSSGLKCAGFEVRVVSLFDAFTGGFEPELDSAGVAVVHLGKRKGFDPRMWVRLYRVIRDYQPDIVHSHSYLLRYVYPAALLTGRPVMVHTVHNLAAKEADWFGRWLNRIAYRGGVVPVAVGEEVARSFGDVYGSAVARTVPNGADLSLFGGDRDTVAWRAENGFPANARLAISVARLDPQKNPVGLVEAFHAALGGQQDWQLLLVGAGSLENEVRTRVRSLGLTDRVHLLGLRGDVADALTASDLFVMASEWEGMPLAVIEAMAAGLPVVATAVGGVPELVADGETGVLVPPGDPAAFATALRRVAENPDLRIRMSSAARERAQRYSAGEMVNAYASLMRESVAGNRKAVAKLPRPLVLLTTQMARGGAEMQVLLLARRFEANGLEPHVVSLREPVGVENELKSLARPCWSPGMAPGQWNPIPLFRLLNHLRKVRPMAVHAHLFHANLVARCLRLLCPVPVVISAIHSVAESGRDSTRVGGRDALYRATNSLADATVCVSEAVVRRHVEGMAVSRSRVRVIPNGGEEPMDAEAIEASARFRENLELDDKFVWLAVGRLMWKKDYSTLLRAVALLPQGSVLLIAGDGPDLDALRELARERAVDARFLGLRDDVPALLRTADAFVLSSVVEGLPMVLIEASLGGLPCVATDVGGVREIVLDGVTGAVVPAGDPQALADAMRRMESLTREERRKLGEAARRHAMENFHIAAVAKRWETLTYESVEAKAWQVKP